MYALLAAGVAPGFFGEVAGLLMATAVMAYLCHRLRVMPIVSFLVTGALIGPHALGIVRNEAVVEAAAEVGVVLLLFSIGIEFSLAELARIRRLIFIGGGLQIGLVVALVTGVLALVGVEWRTGVFTGCLVALSSTAIVMKLLMGRGETGTERGQAALGILICQDLAVVAMVLLVPLLGGAGGSGWDVALVLGKAAGIVVLVLFVARRLMPRVLEAVARTCSQEIFLLSVVGICFGTAYLTSLAGVSLSLGAFLAGLLVSESRFSEMAFGEILPLQILFSATFFVSVGLLLDVRFILSAPLLVLGILAAVVAIKAVTTGLSMRLLGLSTGTAAFTGLLLAQVGEFSFVLERTGRSMGLFPAGLEARGPQAFIASAVLLMLATPLLARLGDGWNRRLTRSRKPAGTAGAHPAGAGEDAPLRDHVVIAGYGPTGRALAQVLEARGVPYLVVTLSPDGAREAEEGKLRVLRGNYTRRHELTHAGADRARVLVVADDDLETTRRVVRAVRALNPELRVIARARIDGDAHELRAAGADAVVTEERESAIRLVGTVLEAYGVETAAILEQEAALRRGDDQPAATGRRSRVAAAGTVGLSEAQRASGGCSHAAQTVGVAPRGTGCEACLKIGDRWVHLRLCMTCGHVGCCDSSKNRHASKHFDATGHPVIKSLEPGEDWAWCYQDRTFL